MATVYVEDTIEIAVVASVLGRPHVNVWHYRATEGVGVNDEGAVQDFANNWQDHIVSNLSTAYSLERFDWRSLDPDDSNVGVVMPNSAKPSQGDNVANAMSISSTFLVHKNTANRPRGRRDGRAYISGLAEDQVDQLGNVLPATVTAWNATLLDFYNGVTDNPVASDVNRHLVVLETTPASRAKGSQAVNIDARRVTSLTLDPVIGHQRDRVR